MTAPGWYDDGTTPGVLRWFDGSAWTEHTTPHPSNAPAAGAPAPVASSGWAAQSAHALDSAPAGSSSFGSFVPVRPGHSVSVFEQVTASDAFRQSQLREFRALLTRACWTYGTAVFVLVIAGLLAGAQGGMGTTWVLGLVCALVLVGRAVRDYRNARFRDVEPLTGLAWTLVVLGAVLAAAAMSLAPIETIRAVHHIVEPGLPN